MDSLRLIVCVRPNCQQLFFLCRRCDRGQRYCSRACAAYARRLTLQRAGRLYQQSRPGRFQHAARMPEMREAEARKLDRLVSGPGAGAGAAPVDVAKPED